MAQGYERDSGKGTIGLAGSISIQTIPTDFAILPPTRHDDNLLGRGHDDLDYVLTLN